MSVSNGGNTNSMFMALLILSWRERGPGTIITGEDWNGYQGEARLPGPEFHPPGGGAPLGTRN